MRASTVKTLNEDDLQAFNNQSPGAGRPAGPAFPAGGTTYIGEGVAQLFGGATLPFARGRGAQSALLAARARAARAAGCRWLVAETGVESPGTHNSSLHNMVRLGFTALYQRQNWTWRPDITGPQAVTAP